MIFIIFSYLQKNSVCAILYYQHATPMNNQTKCNCSRLRYGYQQNDINRICIQLLTLTLPLPRESLFTSLDTKESIYKECCTSALVSDCEWWWYLLSPVRMGGMQYLTESEFCQRQVTNSSDDRRHPRSNSQPN